MDKALILQLFLLKRATIKQTDPNGIAFCPHHYADKPLSFTAKRDF